ncbi:hypothetical protein PRUPE_3G282100 [Prunus persica]|uniref:Uncharacterized protein n=1 Tax=Prunus persica TaxID=3760 RepID=M5X4I3_PRUPE|nr:hypothetical protein PRUPE_3G282100 [Prunus persica]
MEISWIKLDPITLNHRQILSLIAFSIFSLFFITIHIDMLLENISFTETVNFLIYNMMLSIHHNILT